MTAPTYDPGAPLAAVTASGGFRLNTPPAARRERRAAVERALLAGAGTLALLRPLAGRFNVSTRTIRADVRLVERRWAREDGKGLARRRSAVLRRLGANAEECRTGGDLAGERQALALLAKVLGMVPQAAPVAVAVAGAQALAPSGRVVLRFESRLPATDEDMPHGPTVLDMSPMLPTERPE